MKVQWQKPFVLSCLGEFFHLFFFVLLPLQTTPRGILTMVVGSPEHLTITAEFTESGVWLPA